MRFLARIIGLIALAGAFAAAVIDGARSIAIGDWAPTSTGTALYWLSPNALAGVQASVENRLGAWAWNDVLVRVLFAPVFISLAILSLALYLVSRPPRPEIGRSGRDR